MPLRFRPFRTIARGHQAMHVPKAEVPMTLESWQLFKHDWNLAQPCCIFEMTSLTRSCGEETLSQRRQTSALLNNSVQSLPRLQSYRVAKSALKKKIKPDFRVKSCRGKLESCQKEDSRSPINRPRDTGCYRINLVWHVTHWHVSSLSLIQSGVP